MENGIKNFKPVKGGKFKQGYYTPVHPEKYKGDRSKIIWRSSWELKYMKYLDLNSNIIEWSSEPIAIPYKYVDGNIHKYYPDFYFAEMKNGEIIRYIVECKPTIMLRKPEKPKRITKRSAANYNMILEQYQKNYCKVQAAKEWCNKRGLRFVFLTEESGLGV